MLIIQCIVKPMISCILYFSSLIMNIKFITSVIIIIFKIALIGSFYLHSQTLGTIFLNPKNPKNSSLDPSKGAQA
jgi:hypothetical protein